MIDGGTQKKITQNKKLWIVCTLGGSASVSDLMDLLKYWCRIVPAHRLVLGVATTIEKAQRVCTCQAWLKLYLNCDKEQKLGYLGPVVILSL